MERRSAWEYATSGTYVDKGVPAPFGAVVAALALVLCLLPFVGMIWAPTESTTENRDLAEPPRLTLDDGTFNWNILADSGAYFADHFAFRNQLVAANARLRAAVGVSATDQVVVGSDDWLYYAGTLPDYLGQTSLSDRSLHNASRNLALAQAYIEAHGARFVLAIAPNKNTLYPQHMPAYYLRAPDEGNAARLAPLLEAEGVSYVDLAELFQGMEGEWYLKRDTHWDNRGALAATQAMLASAGRAELPIGLDDGMARDDFVGDVEGMLFPSGARTETNWYFRGYNDGPGYSGSLWAYEQGSDVTDATIVTSSQAGTGRLMMFRDSFGNALVPLWAPLFERATFSKLVPYNLAAINQFDADVVVLERAERNLAYFATTPPLMPSPAIKPSSPLARELQEGSAGATVQASQDGPYVIVEGSVGSSASEGARVYVGIDGFGGKDAVYDAFCKSLADGDVITDDYGYQVNVVGSMEELAGATLRIYVVEDGKATCVKVVEGRDLL